MYEAVGYVTDHYERNEQRVRYSDVWRLWAWCAEFLKQPNRKVVVRASRKRNRRNNGWFMKKIGEFRTGDTVPSW